MTHVYTITSSAGEYLGRYAADSEQSALDALARDAGYRDADHAAEVAGRFDGEVRQGPEVSRYYLLSEDGSVSSAWGASSSEALATILGHARTPYDSDESLYSVQQGRWRRHYRPLLLVYSVQQGRWILSYEGQGAAEMVVPSTDVPRAIRQAYAADGGRLPRNSVTW